MVEKTQGNKKRELAKNILARRNLEPASDHPLGLKKALDQEFISWRTVERPGYLSKKRDEITASWDKNFGKGNWRLAYEVGELIVPREMGIQLYEDGYYHFLLDNPDVLDWLTSTASDVFDTAPTNVEAGFNYTQQETPRNHIHDVSIRRALLRTGNWFAGDHLVHVRGPETEGERLSPYLIPFHLPDLISQKDIKDYGNKGSWWDEMGVPKSVEAFYQRNKVLQVKD